MTDLEYVVQKFDGEQNITKSYQKNNSFQMALMFVVLLVLKKLLKNRLTLLQVLLWHQPPWLTKRIHIN